MSAAGFLSALREDAEDDASRLIAADWLEDEGDLAQAELLRIQSSLDAWEPELETREALQKRRTELLQAHASTWLGPLSDTARRWDYRRGLFEVSLRATTLLGRNLKSFPELYQQGWVGRLHLSIDNPRQMMARLARTPRLAGVVDLDLSGNALSDDDLPVFLESFHLDALRRLDLSNNALGPRSIDLLERKGVLARLLALGLRNNHLTDEAVEQLLDRCDAVPLRDLDACGNGLAAGTRIAVARFCKQRGAPSWCGSAPRRLINSLGMEFERIPAGTFRMGSAESEPDHREHEGPIHTVRLTRPFYLSRFLTTQMQYREVLRRSPSFFHGNRADDAPVDSVSFENALLFCRRLEERSEEQAQTWTYRLPTEAEWEHACRAGTLTPYWWGDMGTADEANFDGTRPYNTRRMTAYLQHTTTVGAYRPNPFGLFDTHGNLWEWCQDYYLGDYYRQGNTGNTSDPTGPREGNRRVLRGGSWHSDAPWCRAAYRCSDGESSVQNWYGFRVVLEPGPTGLTPR